MSPRWLLIVILTVIVGVAGGVLGVAGLLAAGPVDGPHVVWGNVAEWVSGVGTTGALIAAVLALDLGRRETRAARLQARRAQASKISAQVNVSQMIDPTTGQPFRWNGQITVVSRSDEPIFHLVPLIRDQDAKGVATMEPVAVIAGGSTVKRHVPEAVLIAARHETLGRPSLVYSFVDNAGLAWQRDNLTGGLRERPTPEWVG